MVVNTTKHVNMDDLRRILSEIKYINLTEVRARDGQRESAVLELNLVIYPGHACMRHCTPRQKSVKRHGEK